MNRKRRRDSIDESYPSEKKVRAEKVMNPECGNIDWNNELLQEYIVNNGFDKRGNHVLFTNGGHIFGGRISSLLESMYNLIQCNN